MADITTEPTNNTSQDDLMPPTHVPVGSDYEQLKIDLPLEQPLIFYLDGSKAFYLPHEMTDDESTHTLPQSVVDTLTNKRIFQEISIRQGQSGMFHSPILILTKDGPLDMSNYLVRFEGRDASEAPIYSDEGFNRIQANLGRIDWSPEAVIAQSAGYYKNAHLVIESTDRTKIFTTLDFSINIIANDVALPRILAFYSSEYQRLLYHIKEMQTSADHQLSYLLNMYAAVIVDSLNNVQKQMDAVKADLDKSLKDGNDKIDNYVVDQNKKLDATNAEITTAQGKMNDLETQMHGDNLVTLDGLYSNVQIGINTGEIDPHVNDVILDSDVSSKVDDLTNTLTEGTDAE
ncbi:hypothetical protein [Companilactobacillus jidongensis]|uniref:hypothetical protein n=1 Tax=Companilactobacillus jidongensis TaxID=2486006 RepID=UPI000F7668A8|nr:hypothetical protein [Companilactobacillus jidongensis]